MKASALKDLPILSIDRGQRLGRVRDVLYDPQDQRVAALVVDPGGGIFANRRGRCVLFGAIQSIGDAVTVGTSEAVLQDGEAQALGGLPSLLAIQGDRVVDTAGKLVGDVTDVEIDPATGELTLLRVQQGGVLGLGGHTYEVPAVAIHSLGGDAIIIEPVSARR